MRHGLLKETVLKHARQAVLELPWHFGGLPGYPPRGESLSLDLPEMQIFRIYTGYNSEALDKRIDVMAHQIQITLVTRRALHLHKVQGRLLEAD